MLDNRTDSSILMAHLFTALNWLKYMTFFQSPDGEGGFPPFSIVPPKENPWGFTADCDRIRGLMKTFMGIPEEDPTDLVMLLNVDDRWGEYYQKEWLVFHRFLKDNQHTGLFQLRLQIEALLSRKRVEGAASIDSEEYFFEPEEECGTPDARTGFLLLVANIVEGKVEMRDLLARPTDKAWDTR